MITAHAWARAGLLGNPSDGYGGKTLSVTLANFSAAVTMTSAERLTIPPDSDAIAEFSGLSEFVEHVARYGYYGSDRLLRAALVRFHEFCQDRLDAQAPNFTMRATSTIPRAVGLAGSSAIVTAALRALCAWYGIEIAPDILASLALSVERDALGIPAGLQDRVVQAYEGLIYMDFSSAAARTVDNLTMGNYERLDASWLPPLYIAYARHAGEPTEVTHSELRQRFLARDPDVLAGLQELAQLAERGRDAIQSGNTALLSELMNRNFDIRRRICRLRPDHVEMVLRARHVGASAKYCGSGGAIVGIYDGPDMLARLTHALAPMDCAVAPLRVALPVKTATA